MKTHLTTSTNEYDIKCADIFCGLIEAASAVFAYHLTLGGGYTTTEHHAEIFDLLQKLYNIIEPYEKTHIDV